MSASPVDQSLAKFANRGARQRRLLRAAFVCAGLVWAGFVGFGLERMWRFATTPGAAAHASREWPSSSLITPRPGHATLVMFVHPQCSCTTASLAELRNVLQRSRTPLSAWILLLQPQGAASEWQRARTAAEARLIANVTVVEDRDGSEAARFDAQTSGQVVLFDAQGQLVYEGGITGSRGHEGDNAGERSVVSFLNTGVADHREQPVFGCGLHDPQRSRI